jgi:hypothetical protein
MLVLLLLGLYRPKPGCSRCDDYSEDNGTCTAGKLCQRLQICCCEAGDEACDYNSENDTAFACRRNDNSKEHAKQRNAQCTYNAFWQRCTGDNAAGCANRPAWNGYGHASIVIVWIQNTGQGIANPLATILSVAMMLRYSLNQNEAADAMEAAVDAVMEQGYRTPDLYAEGLKKVSTSEMGHLVAQELLK